MEPPSLPLFAYIVYKDNEKAVVPVGLIKDYKPRSVNDLAKNKYIYWHDKNDPGEEGFYLGDIEELAATTEELAKKLKKRRIRWPSHVFNKVACAEVETAQVMSQKEKKAKKKKSFHRKLNFAVEQSSSSEEELVEKGALLAKEKEIEKLQCEVRSLRKKLAEERRRNFDLQEVVVKGMGEVQELTKRKACECSMQQQMRHANIAYPTSVEHHTTPEHRPAFQHHPALEHHPAPEPEATPNMVPQEPTAAASVIVRAVEINASPAQEEIQMQPVHILLPALPACAEQSEAGASADNEVQLACGITLPAEEKWQYLLSQPKDSLFVRETAKSLWTVKELFNRSVTVAFEKHMDAHPSDTPREVRLRLVNRTLGNLLKVMKN